MTGLIQKKQQTALYLAILFHAIGLLGILFVNKDFFTQLTPLNLLVSFALVLWTQEDRTLSFWFLHLSAL